MGCNCQPRDLGGVSFACKADLDCADGYACVNGVCAQSAANGGGGGEIGGGGGGVGGGAGGVGGGDDGGATGGGAGGAGGGAAGGGGGSGCSASEPSEATCSDGIDNDCDSSTDCL